jgi:hypothetical protein
MRGAADDILDDTYEYTKAGLEEVLSLHWRSSRPRWTFSRTSTRRQRKPIPTC